MTKKNVMSIGLHPDVVNYALFPGLSHEKLTADLKAQEEHLQKLGFATTFCLVDLGETAEQVARAALQQKQYDAVVIGAGVRTPPPHLALFEKLVNAVHELAPKAKICFNARADDTADAILRWVRPS